MSSLRPEEVLEPAAARELGAELGLTPREVDHLVTALGRTPGRSELTMAAGMWSEHCSYKSTRPLLRDLPKESPRVLAGPGSHAGCVDVGEGWGVAFKIESHNHPSAVEPYQGAATGVGGILRDVVAQGARPCAVMDSLCFGDPESGRTRWLVDGIVAGIAGYGNSYGVPNVGGKTMFDPRYEGNPLVNALAAGLVRHDQMRTAAAAGAGNAVLYVGATTGRDGILGAAFASEELEGEEPSKRSHVQVGDPFMGKKLLEALMGFGPAQGLVAGQDMGASGISCATVEMAACGGVGLEVDLEAVPTREPGMAPHEILLSESQERFLLVVDAARAAQAREYFEGRGVHAAIIGQITAGDRVRVRHQGELVADLPAALLAEDSPLATWEPAAALPPVAPYPEIPEPEDPGATLLALLAHPNVRDRSPLWSRYDSTVGNRTVRGPAEAEAAVLKLPGSHRGFALTIEGRGDACAVDPYLGVQQALGEARRNLACAGADLIAVTDGLNQGSPSNPVEYLRLVEVIRGLGDGLRTLGVPVTGGNCSLYNESRHGAIPPTPMVGGLGVVEDVAKVPRSRLVEGEVLLLLGEVRDAPCFSRYGALRTGSLEGHPPAVDLPAEDRLARFLLEQIGQGRIRGAKATGLGGLGVALAKLCIRSGVGVSIEDPVRGAASPAWALFGEHPAQAWVSATPEDADALERAAQDAGLALRRTGAVGGDRMQVADLFDLPLGALRAAFTDGSAP